MLLILKAQDGLITTHGKSLIQFGDNPGGSETAAFILHNNPMPTLKQLFEMFFKGGNVSMGNNNRGEVVVNVSLNIRGNEIVDQRRIIKRVKTDLGANRWRFGG